MSPSPGAASAIRSHRKRDRWRYIAGMHRGFHHISHGEPCPESAAADENLGRSRRPTDKCDIRFSISCNRIDGA
ncbi:similar to An06g01260 [Aspergillus luchuensis]|uniref:Similar to An06g01260 n=1 Tax=Aspergillus kawachii TaxID=1069201 RepID=A0A146F379_ASPKA|nr:similar to An06g01260 [Aspergillus luchuensis]